jgi:hypothetical protein
MRLKNNQKLFLALTAYVVLGFLAWQTLNNDPITMLGGYFVISFRKLTLFILGFFTVRTVMDFLRYRAEEKREAQEGRHQ